MILQMVKDGLTEEQIGLYLQGAYDGIKTFRDHLAGNRMKMKKGETDPLFVHTWNYVVEAMVDKIDSAVAAAFPNAEEDSNGPGERNPGS